ncbi:MAG: cytochrome c [Verrucomicrobia bacterium]|nr:cytochrome c [Verrucomicrobiota bacterium]
MKTTRFVVASIVLSIAGAALASFAADAGANWTEHCAKCHGPDGKGQTKMGKKLGLRDLADAQVQAKFTDEQALRAMKEGVKDKDGKQTMKPAEGLSEADMKALVGYVRSLKK